MTLPHAAQPVLSPTSCIEVVGGTELHGTIWVSGAKNASLPLMAATALSPQPVVLRGMPLLSDVDAMARLLTSYGAELGAAPDMTIHHQYATPQEPSWTASSETRTGILLLGAHLARFGKGLAHLPGGCAIGERPIDLHLSGLRQMGAQISIDGGVVNAHAKDGLHATEIVLRFPSVGATEQLMIAACGAQPTANHPTTIIRNAAREPEIENLARLLQDMGFAVAGAGSSELSILGRDLQKSPVEHAVTASVIPDRIQAGTLLLAVLMTGGEIVLKGIGEEQLDAELVDLLKRGGELRSEGTSQPAVRYAPDPARRAALGDLEVSTAPWPGLCTDLQAQVMATMAVIGTSRMHTRITETIFENRFQHAAELRRLGAQIRIEQAVATVTGGSQLQGADVEATDLRASACLVMAGLVAQGTTRIHRFHHLDRGYEDLVGNLHALGAKIRRIQ